MKRPIKCWFLLVIILLFFVKYSSAQRVQSWSIPSEGNAFFVRPNGDASDHSDLWQNIGDYYVIGFHADRQCDVRLSLNLTVPKGKSKLLVAIGNARLTVKATGEGLHAVRVGRFQLEAGYTKIEIHGLEKTGDVFAKLVSVELTSATEGLVLNYVKDNIDNRFYWGRRGPSVHLNYELPEGAEIEYFYNELTVPVGQDPVGSYFMADGFGEGYFGMQVNSPTERRVLFSVWSPYKTDKPGEIPENERIILLAKGEGVHTGEFGNEGSGGQSYWRTSWKAGTTYGFLLKGCPDGKGNTVYTAWFYDPEAGKWQLIASFQRPKTDHYLRRLHSFLENFADYNGYLGRKCLYANAWCLDKNGKWFRLTKAKFTGDDIAKRGYRLDYAGGVEGNNFFLQNGGFFNNSGCKLQSSHQLPK